MHLTRRHKHFVLNHIYILLIIICAQIFHITLFSSVEGMIPEENTHIVVENEPQILPDQQQEATETSANDEIIPGKEESLIGEYTTGEITAGVDMISGDEEYFSGVIKQLSGSVIYNISGDVVGEVHITLGNITSTDLSGNCFLSQPLSIIYPEMSVALDASGYIRLDTLESVIITGGDYGKTYGSRIAYENISNILKAGVRTFREIDDYVLKGDADDLLDQGLRDSTILEVSSMEIQEIFSGKNGTAYGLVYDIYITFVNNGESRTYHRITVVYADDHAASAGAGGQRYVLDPLHGAKTINPQLFADYFAYYRDKIHVRWYVGQAYIPSIIMKKFSVADNIRQLLQEIFMNNDNEVLTGVLDPKEVIGEVLIGEIFTGQITIGGIVNIMGENLLGENLTGMVFTGENDNDTKIGDIVQDLQGSLSDSSEIVTGYFTKAYGRGVYSEKIIELQKLLTWLQLYNSALDGVYSDAVIESVYQYQLLEQILTPQDPLRLRGYLGPSTRNALNSAYVQYQLYMISKLAESRLSSCDKQDIQCRKQELADTLTKKGYILTNRGLVRMSKEALVGSENLDMSEIRGELMMPIVLQSINELNGKIAEVQFPVGTIIKTVDGNEFTGEIAPPEFIDVNAIQADIDQDVIAAIDVGSDTYVQFEDMYGNAMYATIRVPVPGVNIGDTIDINYSQDGDNRIYLNSVDVQAIDGTPYAIFESNHFTQFYLGMTTGTFTIANDATYATGLAVVLTNNVTGATHMRFGNTIAQRDAALWTGYQTGFNRNLSGADGIHRVYAQFSGNGFIRNVSDNIILDIGSVNLFSGLQLYLDGTTGGARFIDSGPRGLIFTGIGNARKDARSGETIMYFDGNGDFADNGSGFIVSYPFTISAWVRPSNVVGIKTIVSFGSTASPNIFRRIQLNNNTAQIVARNLGTTRTATSTATLVANQRYHIVGVFNSATDRRIYVDNANIASSTASVTFSNANPRRRVGSVNSTPTNFFSGRIDEVRVYNKALTTGERQDLYMQIPSFDPLITSTNTPTLYGEYTPKTYLPGTTLTIGGHTIHTTAGGAGKRKTVPFTTGLVAGTYTVTLNYMNVYGKTGSVIYTSGLIITPFSSTGIHINYSTTGWTSGNVVATLTGLDPTYQIVNNFGSEFTTFTSNGSFTYQFIDQVGTTGSITATVTWIDKIAPIFAGVASGAYYSGNIAITFSDANLLGATLNGVPYTSGSIITGAGIFVFVVRDLAGNSTGATFSIQLQMEQKINNQLINLGYIIGSTGLVALDGNYYIGTANIDMSPFAGQLLQPVVIQSSNSFGGNLSEVEIPAGAVLQNAEGSAFTGILQAPVFQTPGNYDAILGQSVISAISVGSTNHIYFKDTGGNDLEVTFRIPVPGRSEGELIDIYTSENGSIFDYHITAHVQMIGGNPYVIFTSTHFSVIVTVANNGINISADKAGNATTSGWTVLSNIVMTEGMNRNFGVWQTNVTLILTAPTNRRFRAGVGTVSYIAGRDITAATIAVTTSTATITYTTNGAPNRIDALTISGLQIQAITGNILPSDGNILRTCANPGTAPMVGIICNVTNFGSLSQTFGAAKNMIITLSGQTFIAGIGNSGTPIHQTANIGFTIPFITVVDQFKNIVASYTGNKTLSRTGAGGTPSYTTGVLFTSGQSITTLHTTLTEAKNGVVLTVTDGTLTGLASSPFDVLAQGTISIAGPANFNFSVRTASDQQQTIEMPFSGSADYFQVMDRLGSDTGYYTTISISDMNNENGDVIPHTSIAVKALTGVVTLSGTNNARVYSAITGTYQYFTASPLTFIKRDTAPNSGVTGVYGLHTVWKIDLPAMQNIGTYTGVITYTLY